MLVIIFSICHIVIMKFFLNFDFFKENLATFCCLILSTLIARFRLQTANLQENNKTPNQKIKKSCQNANGKFDLQHQFILSLQTAVSIMKKKLSKLVLNDVEQKVSRYSSCQPICTWSHILLKGLVQITLKLNKPFYISGH